MKAVTTKSPSSTAAKRSVAFGALPMKIGIIGAGNIGGCLARKLVALGHSVAIANSHAPSTLTDLAKRIGARAVTVEDVVKDVEVVILSIPMKSVADLPKELFRDIGKDVIVVDTGNYYPSFRDGPIEDLEKGRTESGWVEGLLGRAVVKAFNNIMVQSLADGALPKGTAARIALPISGDNARAKSIVLGLVEALGFDAIDAGSIEDSWRQQPGTLVYCTDLNASLMTRALGMADRAKTPETREQSVKQMFALPKGTPHADIVRKVREVQGAPTWARTKGRTKSSAVLSRG